jgi:chromate transport protein ChrA
MNEGVGLIVPHNFMIMISIMLISERIKDSPVLFKLFYSLSYVLDLMTFSQTKKIVLENEKKWHTFLLVL